MSNTPRAARPSYGPCTLCPRNCGVNRAQGERGVCGVSARLRVARAMLHHWEEPPISGTCGSGAVFFSGCPLHCVYCQNAAISDGKAGRDISVARLAEIFLELQRKGAHNVNLVTPTHYVPSIMEALELAGRFQETSEGERLTIPVVYNTGGYESVDTLRALEGYVDVYLTDFKYASPQLAQRYSHAADYPEVAARALAEMVRQTGAYRLEREPEGEDELAGSDGNLLLKGVIVRQLLLPGEVADALEVTRRVFGAFGNRVCYSLMNQYTPLPQAERFPQLQRPVTDGEYDELIDGALDLGVRRSFMQEGGTVAESFIPAFDGEGV